MFRLMKHMYVAWWQTVSYIDVWCMLQLLEQGDSLCSMVANGVSSCLTKEDLKDCTATEMGWDGITPFNHSVKPMVVRFWNECALE